MHHVVVMPLVSTLLGATLSRESLLAVLVRMRDQLESHYDRYRSRRDSANPDDFFEYVLNLADANGDWHTMRFTVNDRQAEGFLFVVAVSHRLGKRRMK
jgi:hypothetical protein